MAIGIQPPSSAGPGGDVAGHTYRLGEDQIRRAVDAGIIAGSEPLAHPLNVDQYDAMVSAGILTEDDPVELLEGWLVAKMTKEPPHEIAKGLAQDVLTPLIPAGWFLGVETPLAAVDSKPEPDLAIIRGRRRDYAGGAPGPAHVDLIVEAADSSLWIDRSMKKRLYARSGFAVYWLINIVNHRVEVYTNPSGPVAEPDYLTREEFGPDDAIAVVLDGREVGRIVARDLLP